MSLRSTGTDGNRPYHTMRCPTAGAGRPSWSTLSAVVIMGMGVAGCQEQPSWLQQDTVLQPLPPPIVVSPPRGPTPPPPPVVRKTLNDVTVVVDAGHGGHDPGAMPKYRGQLREKDINLDIASDVADILRSRGARVVMTRSRDVFIELDDRARMADRYRADVFISVHADASPKRYRFGSTVYIYTRPDRETQAIAQCITSSLRRSGIACQGVYRKNLHVLREHDRPGVLVETGFLTNAAEADKLNNSGYRTKVATAIADGITDHFGRAATASSR